MKNLWLGIILFLVLSACYKTDKNHENTIHINKNNDTTKIWNLKVNLDDYIGKKVEFLLHDLSIYYEKDPRFKYFYKSGQDDISDSMTIDRCAFIFNYSDDEYLVVRIHIDIDSSVIFPRKVKIYTNEGYYSMENNIDVNLFFQEKIVSIYPIVRKKKIFEEHLFKEIEEFKRLKNLY